MLERILFLFKNKEIPYSIEFHKVLIERKGNQEELSIMLVRFKIREREHHLKIGENQKRLSFAIDIRVSSDRNCLEFESKRIKKNEVLKLINLMIDSPKIEEGFLLPEKHPLPKKTLLY